jgi:alpha 1,2-mannosyltransferase
VYFIRRTGSLLPIEVWAPPHEPIHPAVAADFAAMRNVSVRTLEDTFTFAAHDDMEDRKFLAKQLSILASQFQEVLFLDADNIPLRDPAFLFDEPAYKQHGLLMWPDFWRSQAKPGAWDALGIPPELRPPGSHESGQVVIDKQRAWKPLLLAIYLNMRGDVFYPLFSDMGQGDKETLPFAWVALGYGKYGLVQHGVLALGFWTQQHTHHAGTAMLQRSPDGIPMFLHAHMPKIDVPKQHIKLPPASRRQWDELTGEITALPAHLNLTSLQGKTHSYEVLNAVARYDVEVESLQLRRYLRCQPAWVACCMG